MSGMKFRRTCSSCNATFFSPDRKASLCLKCSKKRVVKHIPAPAPAEYKQPVQAVRVAPRGNFPRSAPAAAQPRREKTARSPKTAALTPELRDKIIECYENSYTDKNLKIKDIHGEIAEKLWVKRKLVADVLRELNQTRVEFTNELKARAIEMYKRFVENGHRPDGGRRKAISVAFGVPYKQVMNAIREWSLSQYEKSPTPTPSRQQLFEIEKTYWSELEKSRYGLIEMPDRIAEQLGYVTRWQVLRWLDVLHDDERAFVSVSDPSPELQERILEEYQKYLDAPAPPEHGLHITIANNIGKVSPRQVHKILQIHRHKRRASYPHI
ncbi:MAG: hypothetical protein DMF61_24530 [Blastocatellia bacterium AA13]|nr:MAG: hypothetical protein DMF61_24530 [Blastocatellia bacterium AA13]